MLRFQRKRSQIVGLVINIKKKNSKYHLRCTVAMVTVKNIHFTGFLAITRERYIVGRSNYIFSESLDHAEKFDTHVTVIGPKKLLPLFYPHVTMATVHLRWYKLFFF